MRTFPTSYQDILKRIDSIDPEAYARTRNFIDGSVTALSPYISRGVISCRGILESLKARGLKRWSCEKLVQELAWREYFQRVLQERPELVNTELKNEQTGRRSDLLPSALTEASSGIDSIDRGIQLLYETGYMHNHVRMYVASLACNVAGSDWRSGGRWMYYHLLDADPASNFCSWQWVCGAFSSKKYYASQENINHYCHTHQQGTFLDKSYEELPQMEIPPQLAEMHEPLLMTELPVSSLLTIDHEKPLLIYDFFNLDPEWRKDDTASRVLLLPPSLFQKLPVSKKVVDFTLQLAKNIPGIQIFKGEFIELEKQAGGAKIIFREHPFANYAATCEQREWMFPEVKGYYPSFSAYWKKCMPYFKEYFS